MGVVAIAPGGTRTSTRVFQAKLPILVFLTHCGFSFQPFRC
jgi:hypothetical protein